MISIQKSRWAITTYYQIISNFLDFHDETGSYFCLAYAVLLWKREL